jgi:hypothetical protein
MPTSSLPVIPDIALPQIHNLLDLFEAQPQQVQVAVDKQKDDSSDFGDFEAAKETFTGIEATPQPDEDFN